jgi:hypothetical protein
MHVADAALAEIRSARRSGYRGGCVVGGDVSTLAQERGLALTGARSLLHHAGGAEVLAAQEP